MADEQGNRGRESLRQRAERMVSELQQETDAQVPFARMDVAELLQELNIYQIELEIQNEELRAAQVALTEAHDRYSHLYEFAPVGYLSIDSSGMIVAPNLTFGLLLGVERATLAGRRFAEFMDPESQDELHKHLLAVFASPFKRACDLKMRHPNGEPLYVRLESIADEVDGEIPACRATVTDITELQRARLALNSINESLEALVETRTEELRDANARLKEEIAEHNAASAELERAYRFGRALIDTARTIVLVLDPEGQIVFFNRYLEELCGYSLDELRGKDWFRTLIPDRDRARLQQLFATTTSGAPTFGNVNAIVTKSGDQRYIEWYDAMLKTPDGEFRGLLCTGQDVTERRTLQERLLSIAEQEQQRIGQQLHDDLGQELAALKLTMDTMVENLQGEHSAEEERATRVTDGLVSALRKVRELSHGLTPYPVTVENFADEFRTLCNSYPHITCRCECALEAIPSDEGVAVQLYYIAREALTNAVKHGQDVDLEVVASMKVVDHKIVLSVRDNGPGFGQADRHAGGSGLNIMRYRAELIGAELNIESPPKGGTVVSCVLPIQ